MEIQINPKDFGGTEFLARPSQLHLGAQNAVGVDRLTFRLPAAWKDLAVTFHVRHSDGSLAAPLLLDSSGSVPVSRTLTGWTSGQWMLCAAGTGYTAYTRPGRYDVHTTLPTDGAAEEPPASLYEQFVAQVLADAAHASADAARAEKAADRVSGVLRDPLSALVLSPYTVLSGPEKLTADGATLTRDGTHVRLAGSGSTAAVWPLPSGTADRRFRITGHCAALTGGVRLVLNGTTKAHPDETEYYPLATLAAGADFAVTLDLADYSDLDLREPLDIRFLCTAAASTADLEDPTLYQKTVFSRFVAETGSTLGEVLQRIEAEMKPL